MNNFEPFRCPECGEQVRQANGKGRLREYRRGVPPLAIPDDFLVPTCPGCGETYWSPEDSERLTPFLEDEFKKWLGPHVAELCQMLTIRHGLNKSQIARICGVTPSHLSHVLSGTAVASDTLVRLLEALAACSPEVQRHMVGAVFDHTRCTPFLVHTAPDAYAEEPTTSDYIRVEAVYESEPATPEVPTTLGSLAA